jgi:hypothetical protein
MSTKFLSQNLRRNVGVRNKRDKILIVCEGKKTEPNYFAKFPVKKEIVEVDIDDAAYITDTCVERAIALKEEAERNKTPYNQVWCVFDRDSHPLQGFNRAFQLADNNKIRIAYSNEAFELWYVLHYDYHVTGSTRDWYKEKLNSLLDEEYRKNSQDMYDKLKSKQERAIKHAEKLLNRYPQFSPHQNNPSTTVHKLVQELNKYK